MKTKPTLYFSDILTTYRSKLRKDLLLQLLLKFLIVNLLFLVSFVFLESIWYLSPQAKNICWLFSVFNIYFVAHFILILLPKFKHKHEQEAVFLTIGSKYPELKDTLLNHFQLNENSDDISQLAVKEFIVAHPLSLFKNAYSPSQKGAKLKIVISLALVLLLQSVFLFPGLSRIFHPNKLYEPVFKGDIAFSISDTSMYSYDSLSFQVIKKNADNFLIELFELEQASGEKKLILKSADSVVEYSNYRLNSSKQYLAALRRPSIFYPRMYPALDSLKLDILQRPKIKSLDIKVISPAYSMLPDVFYQGNIEKIRALEGSRFLLDIILSETPGQALVKIEDDSLNMDISLRSCSASFSINKGAKIQIIIKNKEGIQTESIPEFIIDVDKDQYPGIRILSPKKDQDYMLNENMNIAYVAHVQDDFGLSKFELEYSIQSEYAFANDSTFYRQTLDLDKSSRVQTRAGIWQIDQFISPGSEIRYSFLIYDNDAINGPKMTRSALFYASLPTLSDLFESNREQSEETRMDLEKEAENIADIAEDIEALRKELLQEGELDWENKSQLEENLNMLKEGQKELKTLQEAMENQKKMMDENSMFSDKVMDDFQQLQELMDELIDDELFKMMQEIQEKLKSNDDSNMEKIMEDFSEKAKKFEESLERMLDIFKQIQQEQGMEELNERIKESLREQDEILEKTEQSTNEELAEQEDKLAKETKSWEEQAEALKDLFSQEEQEIFEEFLNSMNEENTSDMMQEASENFSEGRKQEAQKQSQQAKEKLEKLSEQFSSMSSQMMEKQKDDVENAFRKAFLQCMYISENQEMIREVYADIAQNSPLIHAFTSKENELLVLATELNRGLLELSKKTFLVDKAIGQQLGAIIGNLKSGIQFVEEAKLSNGKIYFSSAYKSMNELGRLLLERMTMVRDEQKGNASGMDFYMKQLQQMAGQQQQLNQGMEQMGMNGSPSQSMMEQLSQMAAKQQALRRSLKGMQQTLGENGDPSKKMMGDLGKIANDMEDVINQMRQNKVNRETIVRQEKIQQRLLDASRSATSRDFKKERESKSAQTIEKSNPLSLPSDLGDHESLINEIRRELRDSKLNPKEKREMEYFLESLLNEDRWKEAEK